MKDWELYDKPWSRKKIEGLVKSWDWAVSPSTGEMHAVDGDGWYGMKARAYDSGNPESILDCIQLEQAVDQMTDMHEKAAVILRMHGWHDQDIGAILSSRRTGKSLVDGGISSIRRIEGMRNA